MFKHPRLLFISLVLAGTTTLAAQASETAGNDAQGIKQATIPLGQAVKVAVEHTGGQATRAEYEKTEQGPAYDVEVVNRDQVWDVRVNATTGDLISSVNDPSDQDDQKDQID